MYAHDMSYIACTCSVWANVWNMYAIERMTCERMCAQSSKTWQGGTPFSSFLPFILHGQLVTKKGCNHRILENRDLATHGDSAGGVHLRPPPPMWADGHWLPMRSAPDISLILHESSQLFTSLHVKITWEGLTLVVSLYIKKCKDAPACLPFGILCLSAFHASRQSASRYLTGALVTKVEVP